MAVVAGTAVGADLLMDGVPSDRGVPLWLVGLTALAFFTLRWRRFGGLWVRFGSFYAAGWITLLLGATGGTASHYIYLFAVLLILAAINHTPRALLAVGVVAVLGAVSPWLYDPAFDASYLRKVFLNASFVFVAALAIQRLVSALAASEERFRLLAENAQDVVYRMELGPDVRLSYVSAAVERLTGYSVEELRAGISPWDAVVHPEDRQVYRDIVDSPPREPLRVTVRIRRRDGQICWIEDRMAAVFDDRGQATAIEGIFRDVTERVVAQAVVEASEEQYRSIAENASDIIYRYRLEPTRGLEFVNDVAEAITGFTVQELKSSEDLIWGRLDPEDRAKHAEARRDLSRLREPVTVRWQRADGTWIWLEERLAPVHDGSGRLVAVNGVVRDVSPQKQTEERLVATIADERAIADQLRAVNELKDAFLQAVSHELRTPLTSVVGYAHTVRARHTQMSREQIDVLLDRLVGNADKLQALLTNLLDVDRLTRGHVRAVRSEVDLGQLICQVASDVDASDHLVTLDLDTAVSIVDGPKVERIVENLLANALRHTPRGTKITVRFRKVADESHLVVEDGGPGVPPDLREEIFEAFRQGHEAAGQASPGTGIGLSLVARLVDLHGGRVWVEDGCDGGAAFHVVLPDGDPDGDAETGSDVADRQTVDVRPRRPSANGAVVPASPSAAHTS